MGVAAAFRIRHEHRDGGIVSARGAGLVKPAIAVGDASSTLPGSG
jgi:hypothetical protein